MTHKMICTRTLKNTPWLRYGLACSLLLLAAVKVNAIDDFELDAPFILEDDIPVVLTAARLKQPRAEVPASVTVISAEQIQAWGVRTIPELMRFVPGMFIGHGDDENNASVIYHASNPNVMRRLQVLIDGRSVFKAAIASVVWDDIPVALEDIARIEVTRGPNAATYGANSYLGVINIISKHPVDTLGSRVRYRHGNQGYDDSFVSYSGVDGPLSYRVSAQINADDGFDGENAENDDEFRNSRRHGFVSSHISRQLDGGNQLDLQFSYKQGHTDFRRESFYTDYPDQKTQQAVIRSKYSKEFNTHHRAHLQAYWQMDMRTQNTGACLPVIALDPDIFTLYQNNPALAFGLVTGISGSLGSKDARTQAKGVQIVQVIQAGLVTPELVKSELGISASAADLKLATQAYRRLTQANDLLQTACGNAELGMDEQRFDIEWQDNVQWSESLRTVSGFSARRDQVYSRTYFDGNAHNDTYRLFANAEWRATDWLVLNSGGMYEIEGHNDNAFSPRVAANFLLTPQQSIRLVYSQAVRSPDLLEQTPKYSIMLTGLDKNYLGLESGRLFVNQSATRDLDHEKITSIELGYYGKMGGVEWDLKLYQDELSQLISNPIALGTTVLTSDNEMTIDGAELQLNWQFTKRDWLRIVTAYVNTNFRLGDTSGLSVSQIDNLNGVETRATAKDSIVASWHHAGDRWSVTASHFWYDAYEDNPSRRYRRFELNTRKEWQAKGFAPWVGVFWHYIIDDNPLVYNNQRYVTDHLYYLQAGLNF